MRYKEALPLRCRQVQAQHIMLASLAHLSPGLSLHSQGLCEESQDHSNEHLGVSRAILKTTPCSVLTGCTGKRRNTHIPAWTDTPSLGSLWSLGNYAAMLMLKSSPASPLSGRSL